MAETKVVTYLQMTSVGQLRPARPVPGVALEPVDDPAGADLQALRSVHDRIAAAHRWSSLGWSQGQWRHWLSDTGLRHWWVTLHGRVIGWGCVREHPGPEMEVDTFGIVPEHIGCGYGGYALTLLISAAWALVPADGCADRAGNVQRVWLHTSTWDHPHALPNYRARGFVPIADGGPHPAADEDA